MSAVKRIGIDFDNTIADYDGVFRAAALERGLVPADIVTSKNAVRDYLNGSGRKDAFTELQGYVYGARMDLARPYAGVATALGALRAAGHHLFIVSHKTRYPMRGPQHDLHAAARGFLEAQRLTGPGGVDPRNIHFELTKEEKVARAAQLGCDVFIDDLPEILHMPGFGPGLRAILFDPGRQWLDVPFERHSSWCAIVAALAGARS
jgi:hypothetical protein